MKSPEGNYKAMECVLKVTSPSKDCFGPRGKHFKNQKCSRWVLVSKWPNQVRLVGLIIAKPVIRKTYTDKINIKSCKRKEWKPLPLTEQQNNTAIPYYFGNREFEKQKILNKEETTSPG